MFNFLPTPILFVIYTGVSTSMLLLNKSIAEDFDRVWTVVLAQSFGTLFFCGLGHATGANPITFPRNWASAVPLLLGNAVWMIIVLWCSLCALRGVSVPLYVVVRNTVPLQTALIQFVTRGQRVSAKQLSAMAITLLGTVIYSMNDWDSNMAGWVLILLNAVLVSGLSVYENALMHSLKKECTSASLNMCRWLAAMPFLFVIVTVLESPKAVRFPAVVMGRGTLPEGYADLDATTPWLTAWLHPMGELLASPKAGILTLVSMLFAFLLGTVLFEMQLRASAASLQVLNLGGKFLTTLVSRVTHPATVAPLGWLGYLVCTMGLALYTNERWWSFVGWSDNAPAKTPRRRQTSSQSTTRRTAARGNQSRAQTPRRSASAKRRAKKPL